MLELGDKSEDEHLKVLKELQSYGYASALLVGSFFSKVSAGTGYKSFSDVSKLIEFIKKQPITGKTILVKGSRGIGLEKIYNLL
jgi:UDP-N-acetylmuramoyl-tripeptide--D-alanyl-D-alanine ligase